MPDETISRREFVGRGVAAAAVAAATAGTAAAERRDDPKADPDNTHKKDSKMKIGFHTDAFNSAYFSFEKCLEWAQKNGVHYIECGADRRRELDPRPGLPAARRPVRGPGPLAAQDGEATACGSRRSTRPSRSRARTARCAACPT